MKKSTSLTEIVSILVLSMGTMIVISAGSNKLAENYAREERQGNCLVINAKSELMEGLPNCSFNEKIPETDWIHYQFNECGDRTPVSCRNQDSDAYRVVIIGSSISMGARVEESETMAHFLPVELSHDFNRPVEVYDAGIDYGTPAAWESKIQRVVKLKPKLILWPVSSWDLDNASLVIGVKLSQQHAGVGGELARVKTLMKDYSLTDLIQMGFHESPVMKVLRTYVYREATPTAYVNFYLKGSEKETGFLKAHWSPIWEKNLADFVAAYARVSATARAEHIPLVVTLIPNRAQSIMIADRDVPVGYDPYLIDRKIKNIVVQSGDTYLDILPMYRSVERPDLGYLPVDGHPNAVGQELFSKMIAAKLEKTEFSGHILPSGTDVGISKE